MESTKRNDALTLAMKLAFQAPTVAAFDEAVEYARVIAVGMASEDVALCRKAARAAIEYERLHGETS